MNEDRQDSKVKTERVHFWRTLECVRKWTSFMLHTSLMHACGLFEGFKNGPKMGNLQHQQCC